MIYGIGNPKFYIYDSTGVTLQKTISTSLAPMRQKPTIEHAVKIETSPFTRTRLRDTTAEYYYYKEDLVYGIGDYNSTLLQYQADQASSKRNDIYKIKQVVDYSDAGYVVKYSPHSDLEDVWGFSPFQVNVLLQDFDFVSGGTNKTDMISVTIEGVASRSSAFMWNEFSFTELSGVTNSNQCISLDGSNDEATFTTMEFGTTHTIEVWFDNATPGSSEEIVSGAVGGNSRFGIDATNVYYDAKGSAMHAQAHGGFGAGSKWHLVLVRSGATITSYKNAALLGTNTSGSNNIFECSTFGHLIGGAAWFSGKIAHLRVYQTALTQAQITQQYNSRYGNYPLDISAYTIWEFDGTGGTSTTETDQSGNSHTLTFGAATAAPTRTTW